ncbi:MAG: putative sulfate exporter family transporter [Deltaproteobacteria bacterium]|nr:putative sulfate exporter family transporter [Deltaproteobacteria bacterium]
MDHRNIPLRILCIIPGLSVMIGTLYVLRTWVEPWMADAIIFGQKGWLVKVLHLNYILLSIIAGMIYRNAIFRGRIPEWAEEGFRTTRLFIKSGVVMLGSLYTLQSLAKVGGIAIALILAFVFGTIGVVMLLGKRLGMDRAMIGVMGAACGVCGVSAAIATSPAVKAKPSDVALAIATVLGFGIMTMFISPFIGHMLQLSDYQFGAWVGTGILNSGQVLATCLAFNPTIAPGTAVAYGEIWNVVRVISIPFVVFVITLWYWRAEAAAEKLSLGAILRDKFPIFVLGFFGMTALSSLGMLGQEGSATLKLMRDVMSWIFGIGLVGQGAYIDLREIRAAGGKPLKVGLTAGVLKYALALIVILILVSRDAKF